MKRKGWLRFLRYGLFMTPLLAMGAAVAQWPERPIRFIVPYPAGGGADIVARILAAGLTEQLGQSVIVENRPGGSAVIGTNTLARSRPDGYVVGMIAESHLLNQHYMKDLPYDSVKDFTPISQLVATPFILVASPKLNVRSVPELVSAAKARPGKINYASIGPGTPHFLAMEWFTSLAGIKLTHVPYSGVAPALNDLVGHQVDVMFTGLSSGLVHVKGGTLTALAVSTAQRVASAPDVPTVAEAGYPDFEFVTWYGLAAPAGTPDAIVKRLSKEITAVFAKPAVRDRLATLGVDPVGSSPEDFAEFMRKAAIQYKKIIDAIPAAAP